MTFSQYTESSETSSANLNLLGITNSSELLGDAYLNSGKYETAIEYYKKGLEIYTEIICEQE